jgi:predicted transcriptional regulator
MKRLEQEVIDSIIDDLKNTTLTQQEIADKYSVSQAIVSYYNKIYNVERLNYSYKTRSKLTQETIECIIDDLKNTTLTQQEIAKKYSIAQGMVSYYNKRIDSSYEPRCRVTQETIDSVIDDLKSTTLTQQEIAEKYNITQGMVSYYRRKYNIVRADSSSYEPKSRIAPEIKEAIIDDLKNSSLTQPEIAEKYNICQTTVIKYKREFNIKRPTGYSPKSKISAEVKFNIINALKYSNMTVQEIADKFHVHATTVEKCKNKYSIKRPSSYDPTRRLAPEIRFKVINDLKYSNLTLQEIADKYSINISSVVRIKKRYNIKRLMR